MMACGRDTVQSPNIRFQRLATDQGRSCFARCSSWSFLIRRKIIVDERIKQIVKIAPDPMNPLHSDAASTRCLLSGLYFCFLVRNEFCLLVELNGSVIHNEQAVQYGDEVDIDVERYEGSALSSTLTPDRRSRSSAAVLIASRSSPRLLAFAENSSTTTVMPVIPVKLSRAYGSSLATARFAHKRNKSTTII